MLQSATLRYYLLITADHTPYNEMKLIENKIGETRIGFAVLLKFFQNEARFPTYKVPKAVIAYIAKQTGKHPN